MSKELSQEDLQTKLLDSLYDRVFDAVNSVEVEAYLAGYTCYICIRGDDDIELELTKRGE